MSFLCLFDLMNFDNEGSVCATKTCSLEQSLSNYLYLLSKYNQAVLDNKNQKFSPFFKETLPEILKNVESGADFNKAKQQVLKECDETVKEIAEKSENDKLVIVKLNEQTSKFNKQIEKLKNKFSNKKELEYNLTKESGTAFNNVIMNLERNMQPNSSIKNPKSDTYKNLISYNNFVLATENVKNNGAEKF